MKMTFYAILIALLLIGITSPSLILGQPHKDRGADKEMFCGECHRCDKPSKEAPCLRDCPRERAERHYEGTTGPDSVVIGELEREYEPVHFNHRLHAEMSSMGHGCLDCHHFSDPNRITACKDCHPVGISNENLEQPGLRGAYHRQCLNCHQEWTGDSQCEVCHAKKSDGIAGTDAGAPRPGRKYAKLEEPEVKVWESTYGGGTIVTLHHRNHTEKYGIECAACHHAEGCSFCHSQDKTSQDVRHTEVALHGICNSCHEEMSCDQCHLKEVAQEFSHERTGWPLKDYHASVQCRACHGNPYHFTKPSKNCTACHRGWDLTSFDHGKTGLVLNETHLEIECQECHAGGDFSVKPGCVGCHDEDVAYPDYMPGDKL